MHEATRRSVCRLGFLALCMLPTCGVLGWGAWLHTDVHREWLERDLTGRLGLTVVFNRDSRPDPRTNRFEDFVLGDPQLNERLLECRRLDIHELAAGLELLAEGAEVSPRCLEQLWNLASHHLRTSGGATIQLRPCDVTLHVPTADPGNPWRKMKLSDVQAKTERISGGVNARIQFHSTAENASAKSAVIEILYDARSTPAILGIELYLPDPLPCSLFAAVCPGIEQLGPECEFAGTLSATRTPAGWNARIQGSLTGVQLESIVAGRIPGRLSGLASVRIAEAEIRQGRLEQASMVMSAGPGQISSSLVLSAAKNLHLPLLAKDLPARQLINYKNLAMQTNIGPSGISIRGLANALRGTDKVVILAEEAPLLGEPIPPAQPIVNLVRALSAESAIQISATPEVSWLTARLPLGPAKR